MSLDKRLISTGLAASMLLNCVTCLCVESEKNQRVLNEPKKSEALKSKVAFTGSALLNVVLAAVIAKHIKSTKADKVEPNDDGNHPSIGGNPKLPASPVPMEETHNAEIWGELTPEEAKKRLEDYADSLKYLSSDHAWDLENPEMYRSYGNFSLNLLLKYLYKKCDEALKSAREAHDNAMTEQAKDARVSIALLETERAKKNERELLRELRDMERECVKYNAGIDSLNKRLNEIDGKLASATRECGDLRDERDRLNREIAELRARPIVSPEYDMYVSKLRLTEAMLEKARSDSKSAPEGKVKAMRSAVSILSICREYLLMRILSLRPQGLTAVEGKRLHDLEEQVNDIRKKVYVNSEGENEIDSATGRIMFELGRTKEGDLPFLVFCNVTMNRYLPIDIQYCANIDIKGDGSIVVHGVSDWAVDNWGVTIKKECPLCETPLHFFAEKGPFHDSHAH